MDLHSIRVLPTFCINERKRKKVRKRERVTCKADLSLSFDVVFSSSVRMGRSGQSIRMVGEKLQRRKIRIERRGRLRRVEVNLTHLLS